MKAIRVIPECDCGAVDEFLFDRMMCEGFSPVSSRAGYDWIHISDDQTEIIICLKRALEVFDEDEIAIVEQVEYVETYSSQNLLAVMST